MPRLCSKRSRPYPGRPVRQAVQLTLDSVLHGNMKDDRTGVSRGHNSSPQVNEGPNPEKGKGPVSSAATRNPTGGVCGRRVAGRPDPDENLLERSIFVAGWDILGYRNTIVQFRKSTTGCGGGCACAI